MEWIIGGIVALVILNALFKPRSCDVCGMGFKKRYHKWKIGGKTQHLCPNCNSRMERKVSKDRFNKKFGR
ncbi:TPA: hypothetical protein ACS72K_003086 [Providencia alcalifaciens]